LDLLIAGQSPGIKERLVDLLNKPEILFFGPDGAKKLSSCGSGVSDTLSRGNGRYDGLGRTYVIFWFVRKRES
jgi:hypothetical protein